MKINKLQLPIETFGLVDINPEHSFADFHELMEYVKEAINTRDIVLGKPQTQTGSYQKKATSGSQEKTNTEGKILASKKYVEFCNNKFHTNYEYGVATKGEIYKYIKDNE